MLNMKRNIIITLLTLFFVGLSANAQKKTFTETVNGVSFKMICVEGGTFTRGATPEQKKVLSPDFPQFLLKILDDALPTHNVRLDSYLISETEVTQELWDAIMNSKCQELLDVEEKDHYKIGKKYPMHNVSWYDAQDFCKKLSRLTGRKYCLPTEAQWEYAARGGKYSKKYVVSGANWENLDDCTVGFYEGMQNVATKKPNELGIYDMSGNVSEWCYDWWGNYSVANQNNPIGPSNGNYKVVRGGGAFNMYPQTLLIAYRNDYTIPVQKSGEIGFRIALIP